MSADPDFQEFVRLLANWAKAPPEAEQEAVRRLMAPELALFDWLIKLIGRHYYPSLATKWGCPKDDFVQDCLVKFLRWLKINPNFASEPDFGLKRFKAMVKTIAINYRRTLHRQQKGRIFGGCGEETEEGDEENAHQTPKELSDEPDHGSFDGYPIFENRQQETKKRLRGFAREMRRRKKMLRTLIALYLFFWGSTYCSGLECYGCVDEILRVGGQHLPEPIKNHLRRVFPEDCYRAINSRLGYLRRAFRAFLNKWGG